MSEPGQAPVRPSFQGFVTLAQSSPQGMLSLRGDLGSATLKSALKNLTGLAVPTSGSIALKPPYGLGWMSPDELLILLPHVQATAAVTRLSADLKNSHYLLVDVSDARAVFTLTGTGAGEVLAKLTPADMSARGFAPGRIRRSRIAQVPAAFWQSAPDQITLVCFRSVAEHVFDLLKNAADPQARVGYF